MKSKKKHNPLSTRFKKNQQYHKNHKINQNKYKHQDKYKHQTKYKKYSKKQEMKTRQPKGTKTTSITSIEKSDLISKTLQYPIPLLMNSLSEQAIDELIKYELLDKTHDNKWQIIYNKSGKFGHAKYSDASTGAKLDAYASTKLESTNRSSIILKHNYTSNDFDITYKINELQPTLIYCIQEEYLLQKPNILAYNNFFSNWIKNNKKFFGDIITHNMPYFDAKYELANKYNYFLKYIYPVDIYVDINKTILEDIIHSRSKQSYDNNNDSKHMKMKLQEINIFSPYMDEGNILQSFLKLQNIYKSKIKMHFKGCTLNKTCFNGYNNLLNLFNIEKKPINKEKYNDNYMQNSFKNNFDLFNGVYSLQDIKPNSLDIIETYIPNWPQLLDGSSYKLASKLEKPKDVIINSVINMFQLLKDGGYIAILIENFTIGLIDLLNNIMKFNNNSEIASDFNQDIDYKFNIEFVKSIRITLNQELEDHDNFIFIFKKHIQNEEISYSKIITSRNSLQNLVRKDIKLSGNRTITAIYELCKSTDKLFFECSQGYLIKLDYKLYQNFIMYLKKLGYKKYYYICSYPKVAYQTIIELLQENSFEIIFIFLEFKINLDTTYLFQKMIQDFKYKYKSEILFMTPDELEQLRNSANKKECYFDEYNKDIKESLFNEEVQIVKEYLTPLFKDYNTIWHNCNLLYTRYFCTAFPDKTFNYIVSILRSYAETQVVIQYKYLGFKNLNVFLPVIPNQPFPNITEIRESANIKEDDMQPVFTYYYSTFEKYAKDGDLIYSEYYY